MLLKGGHPEILKIVREAGLDMGLLGGGGGNGNNDSEEQGGEAQEGGSLLQNIRDSAGQAGPFCSSAHTREAFIYSAQCKGTPEAGP